MSAGLLLPNGETVRPAPLPEAAIQRVVEAILGCGTTAAIREESPAHSAGETAAGRVLPIHGRRQSNLETVFELAGQCLVEDASTPGLPDSGWLGLYIEGARDAEDELEQGIWANWLAAETASPGTINRRSLIFLRSLNAWELASFHEYCAFAFAFESGWRFVFEDERARRELWTYGREHDLTGHWVDIGLLSAEVATLSSARSRGLRIAYRDRNWQVIAEEPSEPGIAASLPALAYRRFSAIGQQLADAMRLKTFNGYARHVIQVLQGTGGLRFEAMEREVAVAGNS